MHDGEPEKNGRLEATRPPRSATGGDGNGVEKLYEHWLYMLDKNRLHCALGPKRRLIIERALRWYALDVLLAAVEGCAASPWHAGENDRQTRYQDLELILRDEPHIERFSEAGYALRDRAANIAQAAVLRAQLQAQQAHEPAADPQAAQAAQAARERLKVLAAQLRVGAGHRT
jgi:hypothetical protein